MYNNIEKNDMYLVYNDYYYIDVSKELQLLYLPLIGAKAVSMYQYFHSRILNESNNLSTEYLHFDLIDNLLLNLKEIYTYRKRLEAIGLIETYVAESDNKKYYIYKLKKPLSFEEFFNNPMLSKILENTIGATNYQCLKVKYGAKKFNLDRFKNISIKFTDLYSYDNIDDYSLENINNVYKGPNLEDYFFDLDKLKYILSSKYLDYVLKDEKDEKDILSIAYMYNATPLDIANAIEKSIDPSSNEDNMNLDKIHDYFIHLNTIVKKQKSPTLNNMLNKKIIEEQYKDRELTNEEKFAKKLDSISYIDFIKKKHGIVISNVDAKRIVELKDKYDFTLGVLNVLLDYCIQESNSSGIPHINYLDKIASSWSNQRIISALDAINLVKSQKEKLVKSKKIQDNKNTYTKKNSKKTVKSPEYIKEQFNKIDDTPSNREQTTEDFLEHAKLQEFLKQEGIN